MAAVKSTKDDKIIELLENILGTLREQYAYTVERDKRLEAEIRTEIAKEQAQ